MPAGRAPQRLRWALLLTGAVLVALVIFTGWQALRAKASLEQVAADITTLSGELTTGDDDAARTTLAAAQDHAAAARAHTRGPGWWLTRHLPGVGPNVEAVRTVAEVVDTLADEVLPTVVDASETLKPSSLRPEDGHIDLEPIAAVAPAVVRADDRLQGQRDRVTAIRLRGLAPEIRDSVEQMQDRLDEAARLSDRAARAVQLLPPMLGAEGRRTYLLLFQNNAEIRATGGIPGAFATVTADHGTVTLGRQGDASSIGRLDAPPIPLTEDERALFGENLGRYPQDVTFTPDFPRSAQLVAAMWDGQHGVKVDGVLSTDPVALSYVLRGTGPITLATGQALTADNAVSLLLNAVYREIPDPKEQNAFFSSVAATVFRAVASGRGEPRAVLEGLVQGASEGRLLAWSRHPAEQELIAPTRLGGVLKVWSDEHPRVSVFLNDGTGAKMDYYLHYRVDLRSRSCHNDRQQLTMRMRMRSTAPEDVSTLPDYVLGVPGGGSRTVSGVRRGTTRTTLYLYAPVDGYVERSLIDGDEIELNPREHDGRKLLVTTLDLNPGQRHSLTVDLVGGSGRERDPVLRVTPGAHGSGVGRVSDSACS